MTKYFSGYISCLGCRGNELDDFFEYLHDVYTYTVASPIHRRISPISPGTLGPRPVGPVDFVHVHFLFHIVHLVHDTSLVHVVHVVLVARTRDLSSVRNQEQGST